MVLKYEGAGVKDDAIDVWREFVKEDVGGC